MNGTDNTTSTPITPVTVSGTPPATSTPITGLTPGDSYSFTVSATNSLGTGPASTALTELLPAPYFPVAPARICDTRASNTTECAGMTLAAGGTLKVQVSGEGGVPAGATAVVANVTVTGATAQSFLTAYPDGTTRPLASNLNFGAGQTVPNLVTVPLSAGGAIDLYNAAGTVNALVDVDGYYGPGSGQGFTSLTPDRICDTRASNTTECAGKTLSTGGTLDVQVTGQGGVPVGATAVVANVTVTGPTAPELPHRVRGGHRPPARLQPQLHRRRVGPQPGDRAALGGWGPHPLQRRGIGQRDRRRGRLLQLERLGVLRAGRARPGSVTPGPPIPPSATARPSLRPGPWTSR